MGYARRRPRFVCGFAGAVVAGDVCGARAAAAHRCGNSFSEELPFCCVRRRARENCSGFAPRGPSYTPRCDTAKRYVGGTLCDAVNKLCFQRSLAEVESPILASSQGFSSKHHVCIGRGVSTGSWSPLSGGSRERAPLAAPVASTSASVGAVSRSPGRVEDGSMDGSCPWRLLSRAAFAHNLPEESALCGLVVS